MKLYFNHFAFTFLILLIPGYPAYADINTYDPPEYAVKGNEFIMPSSQYRIELIQGDTVLAPFVFMMNALQYTNNSLTTSWSQFDFDEPVLVRVYKLVGRINFCEVLPYSKEVIVRKHNGYVEFEISEPGQYSVEFEEGIKILHPLLVFADPMQTDVPVKEDTNVIWFGPGLHEIGGDFFIPSGKTVYLEGGAYLKGQLRSRGTRNITVRGRGILSGEEYPVRSANHMITFNGVNNVEIEGITIIHAPRYMVRLVGLNHIVSNVKMMGWWFSTDGVQTGINGIIEDCFFKVNDDAIKIYAANTIARRCVIWQMENGSPFQIGWGGNSEHALRHIYDCDVIRVEHEWDNENEAIFTAIHGSSGHQRNYLFENIRISNSIWRVFHIVTKPNRWVEWDPDRGYISDITFRNIEFLGEQKVPSLIKGWDEKHPIWNVIFENVSFKGKVIEEMDPDVLYVDPLTTHNVKFIKN